MDREKLTDQLSDEEREVFLKSDSTSCYQFIKKDEMFSSLIQKNINRESLSDEEWEYVLFRLYLVSCKAVVEEESVDFMDHILSFLSKVGMKISRKDKPLYNECFKMAKFVWSLKGQREINADILESIYQTMESKKADDLDLLFHQFEEANIFRTNLEAFMGEYKGTRFGDVSMHERMYLRATERAFEREKELCKSRKKCTNSTSL